MRFVNVTLDKRRRARTLRLFNVEDAKDARWTQKDIARDARHLVCVLCASSALELPSYTL